jgi:DNA invertase Pin-like site-specific DNA recombinase
MARLPVAQYLRMSTEHQQYSTENQSISIVQYAQMHNMEIVRTYADHGKSGLSLARRPGLQQLLRDALASDVDFRAVLVYDVSRWGRFQNPDQGASYEYALITADIPIHYCAEQFANDGSLSSALLKTLKRGMAGEYSRELSVKVWAGQSRLVQLGFRLGGIPGYGLRRHLIDQNMVFKQVLKPGDRKSLQTDRVILVPGPAAEVKVVRYIYKLFTQEKLIESAIANALNAKGIPWIDGRPWNRRIVREILTNPKYIGSSVYNRRSFKLHKTMVHNPPESWICFRRAFKPLITETQFEEARTIISSASTSVSNDTLIEQLQTLYRKMGRRSEPLISASADMPSARIFRTRFGNLRTAYALAGWRSDRNRSITDVKRVVIAQRRAVENTILELLARGGARVSRGRRAGLFIVEEEYSLSLTLVRCRKTKDSGIRWFVQSRSDLDADITVVARLNEANDSVLDYFLLPAGTIKGSYLMLAANNPLHLEIFRFDNLDFLGELVSRTRMADVKNHVPDDRCDRELRAVLRFNVMGAKRRSSGSHSSLEKFVEPELARFYRQKLSKQQGLIVRDEAFTQTYLASASSFRNLMSDEDFRTVLKAEDVLTMPRRSQSSNLHMGARRSPTSDSVRTLNNGLSLEQISTSLPTDFEIIRRDHGNLTRICADAIAILKTHAVTLSSLLLLQRMKPKRQIEVAEQMVASSMCCPGLVRYLLYATKSDMLVEGFQERHNRHWSELATQSFARESEALLRDLRNLRPDLGREALYMTLFHAYIRRILENAKVRSYLERKHADILGVLQLSELTAQQSALTAGRPTLF